jgi:succinate dehydrogenase/fumarate reductase flavoprotein subunit
MGGIAIDETGACGVPGLFVGGEAAGGVHGASRVAGNGCADTLVFGALAGRSAAGNLLATAARDRDQVASQAAARLRPCGQEPPPDLAACRDSIRQTLSNCVGIWRSEGPLRQGLARLEALSRELAGASTSGLAADIELTETRRMALVARAIAAGALARTESRGAHQRVDHPASDDTQWLRHIAMCCSESGELALQTLPIH